jgi:hypothetical protein
MEGFNAMKLKLIAWYIAGALVVLAVCYGAYKHGTDTGMLDGIKAYHKQCYEVGGYIIDDVGNVVACMGQGTIPKEELKHFKSTI